MTHKTRNQLVESAVANLEAAEDLLVRAEGLLMPHKHAYAHLASVRVGIANGYAGLTT